MKQILLVIIILFSIPEFAFSQIEKSSGWSNLTEEISEQPELKIFPNPCILQKITIELNTEELTEIRISNILGKVVMFKKLAIPVNKIELGLEEIPDGIYLVQIKTMEKNILTQKLVVSGK